MVCSNTMCHMQFLVKILQLDNAQGLLMHTASGIDLHPTIFLQTVKFGPEFQAAIRLGFAMHSSWFIFLVTNHLTLATAFKLTISRMLQ